MYIPVVTTIRLDPQSQYTRSKWLEKAIAMLSLSPEELFPSVSLVCNGVRVALQTIAQSSSIRVMIMFSVLQSSQNVLDQMSRV